MNNIVKIIGREILLLAAICALLFIFKKAMISSNERIEKINMVSQEKNDKIEAETKAAIISKRSAFTDGIIFELYHHYQKNSTANLGTKPQFVSRLQNEPKLKKFYQDFIVAQPAESFRFETYDYFRASIQTEFSSERYNQYLQSESEIKMLIRQNSKKLTSINKTDDEAEIKRRTFVLGFILGTLFYPLRFLIMFIPWIWMKATGRG